MSRVAVCISGAFRGNFDALKTIEDNIISPLNADVFFSTWNKKYLWSGMFDIGTFTGHRYLGSQVCELLPQKYLTYNQIREFFPNTFKKLVNPIVKDLYDSDLLLIKQYVPSVVKLEMVNESRFDEISKTYFEAFLSKSPCKVINQLKMFFMMYRCNKLMTDTERKLGFKYDYVIKVRPDVIIQHSIDKKFLLSLASGQVMMKFFWCGLDDIMFFGERTSVDKIASLWKKIVMERSLSPYHRYAWASDHFLLLLHCVSEKIKILPADGVDVFNINLESVRSAGINTFSFYDELLNDLDNLKDVHDYDELRIYLSQITNK